MIHQCNACSYSTEKASNLSRHMFKHTNNRPIECDQCHKKFLQKSDLNRHMKAKHPAIIKPSSNVEHILQNAGGLSFIHDPSISEEPYDSIFNWGSQPTITWEPTPHDDVAANLDQLNAMLQEATIEQQPTEESTVEIQVAPPVKQPGSTSTYHHKCGLCNFHHISSVALAAHQKALHAARCRFFCGKVTSI